MKAQRIISTIDSHTAGERTRMITGGVPNIPGSSMAEKKSYFIEHLDSVRKVLTLEPRGDAELIAAVLTAPVNEGSDMGVMFFDSLGFEGMCGHGTIGIVTTLIETGQITPVHPFTEVRLDTVTGTVQARARVDHEGNVSEVTIRNVPCFVYMQDAQVDFDGGKVLTDIVYGGNFFAILPVERLGMELAPSNVGKLVERGIAFRDAAREQLEISHPTEPDINPLHGVEMYVDNPSPGVHARNIMTFAQHSFDRSPCGTGTSARLALLHAQGRLEVGEEFVHESILGTVFRSRIVEESRVDGYPAIIPEVTGSAYLTGSHQFYIDSRDPFKEGFLLG